jgi:hypothetical protein
MPKPHATFSVWNTAIDASSLTSLPKHQADTVNRLTRSSGRHSPTAHITHLAERYRALRSEPNRQGGILVVSWMVDCHWLWRIGF